MDFGKNRYMPILISALKRRYLAASFFFSFLIIIFTFSGTSWIGKSFLPNIEDDEILVSVSLPAGSPFERTLSVQCGSLKSININNSYLVIVSKLCFELNSFLLLSIPESV